MKKLFLIFFLIQLVSCTSEKASSSKYLRWIGDSEFNALIDTTSFELCDRESQVQQYFNFGDGLKYKGEKKALVNHFFENYKSIDNDQSGWIRIRFIINCNGETGRFRMMGSDFDYKEQQFDKNITSQLMNITKELDGWEIKYHKEKPRDFYQYLIFKIIDGNLKEIMP